MPTKRLFYSLLALSTMFLSTIFSLVGGVSAQSSGYYPNAVTDRLIHPETPMLPPSRNVLFTDPDFLSTMVRATDATTNYQLPGTYLRSDASGKENEWSADTKKFYVLGAGGQVFAFGFDPATMAISSLPNAAAGEGLRLPMRPGTFSFVDPDLIYATSDPDVLTINSYRFSTGVLTPVIDTRTCGLQPPLGSTALSDDDVNLSLDDSRMSISEGGKESGSHMFVVVYDQTAGCRWYNTQTGQIGGQWGATGTASVTTPYYIDHAYISRNGKYVLIYEYGFGFYVWDLATLNLTSCAIGSGMECAGYGAIGYNSYVSGPGILDDMQLAKRPFGNLSQITQLFYPEPSPGNWGQNQHFSWSDVKANLSTPVCGSNYNYEGDTTIDQPYAGEIFCAETDGLASTVWRFAHNRATYIDPYFQTQPLGNVSLDGRFMLFTSDWDAQLGTGTDGTPRSDVFIVKLE
jgi:hypothetical protein